LSEYKLDLLGLCGFGCSHCSSNAGNYLRINRKAFAALTEQQLGERTYPADDPSLSFVWPDAIEKLRGQLATKPKRWGEGQTLVFSMLTDGFSPHLVAGGITEEALRLVVEKTSFRVRVLTKNAIVGSDRWLRFFEAYPGRFVVGLSVGSLDDEWAKRIEIGTSTPSARLRALARLQAAGVPTFGMLCPIFPDVVLGKHLDELIDRINPLVTERIWAEPYNDRANWRVVKEGYAAGEPGAEWLTEVYEGGNKAAWSRYATDLYVHLRDRARREGWITKLRYLLYEDLISERDAPTFEGLEGVLLQSKPDDAGRSGNPFIAKLRMPTTMTMPRMNGELQ